MLGHNTLKKTSLVIYLKTLLRSLKNLLIYRIIPFNFFENDIIKVRIKCKLEENKNLKEK